MFNWFKGETGSALVMVLIITLILSVVGIAVGQYIYNSQVQTERNLNAVQAHYYAKSGVETAMGLLITNLDIFEDLLDQTYYGGVRSDFVTTANEPADHHVEFIITFNGTDISINSLGIVRSENDSTYNASLSTEKLAYEISLEDLVSISGFSPDQESEYPIALFAQKGFSMSGSASINGTVVTNSYTDNSVVFHDSDTNIYGGDLFIGVGTDPLRVISSKQDHSPDDPYNHPNVTDGVINNLTQEVAFPLPIFPEIDSDDLTPMGSINVASWSFNGWEDSSWVNEADEILYYERINVAGNWELPINNQVRTLVVDTLNFSWCEVELVNVGENGRLIVYVMDELNLAGSFNANGDPLDVIVYFKGNEFKVSGGTTFVGSILAESADIEITGGANFTGDITTGGNNVRVSGGADVHSRVLYAPNAYLDMSANYKGAAVVDEARLSGGGVQIETSDLLSIAFFNSLDWPSGWPPSLSLDEGNGGLRQGIWQLYGKWRLLADG